jgi:hypothetical protein
MYHVKALRPRRRGAGPMSPAIDRTSPVTHPTPAAASDQG